MDSRQRDLYEMNTYTPEQQKILQQYEKLKTEELKHLKIKAKHESENKITLFNTKAIPANPPQEKLLKAWENPNYKIFTFCGGNRLGKTTIGVIIALSTLFGKWPWNEEEIPFPHNKPRKIRYVGQGWEDHIKQVVIPALKEWWPRNRPLETRKNNQGVDYLWVDKKTGGVINIMSNNQEVRHFEGWDGDLIVNDEPTRREIRIANARGLVDRQGRELFCATLIGEAWIDREIIKKKLPDGRPDRSVFNVTGTIWDNMGFGLTEKGINQFESTLSEEEKQVRLFGIPSYMQGLVLPQFNRDKHLKPRFKKGVPIDWLVDIAIDIMPKEPQAVLFMATSPRNYKWVVEEIFEHLGGKQLAQEIIKSIHRNHYRVNKIIIDPLAKADENCPEGSTYTQIENVLAQYENRETKQAYLLDLGSKDLKSGIILAKDYLITETGESAVFFFEDLIRTTWEIEGWMWNSKTGKPVEKENHMMENFRRLLQLETRWYEPDEVEDEDYRPPKSTVRTWATGGGTGY